MGDERLRMRKKPRNQLQTGNPLTRSCNQLLRLGRKPASNLNLSEFKRLQHFKIDDSGAKSITQATPATSKSAEGPSGISETGAPHGVDRHRDRHSALPHATHQLLSVGHQLLSTFLQQVNIRKLLKTCPR